MSLKARRFLLLPLAVSVLLLSPVSTSAAGIEDLQVLNDVTARIVLAGGIEADLQITFEDVSGLSADDLILEARLADPFEPALLARLPPAGLAAVPAHFPVLLTVGAAPGADFSMRGLATLSLHTHNLHYTPGTRLRVFCAPPGGMFRDCTAEAGAGSYRAGVRKPDFYNEEYFIVFDLVSGPQVIEDKIFTLNATLNVLAGEIEDAVYAELDAQVATIEESYTHGSLQQTFDAVSAFEALVLQHSGGAVPDLWSASSQAVNAAGELRALTSTLGFSLVEENVAP